LDNEHVISLLTELDAVPGVSGFEDKIGDKIADYLKDCTQRAYRDALGNRIFVKEGRNPDLKLMLSAHMDEIGFMVHDICNDGYVVFLPVGMHDPRLVINQVLTIHTSKGDVIGVTGITKPIHQSKGGTDSPFTFADLKLDIGVTSRAEAEALGVRIGDVMTNDRGSRVLNGKTFSGKSVDNRSGCAAMILAMQILKNVETECTVYCCASVQEEVGIKGSKVAANSINPDVALCVDVCFAALNDEISATNSRVYLGKGPGIQLYDWNPDTFLGNIVSHRMRDALVAAAEKTSNPYQFVTALYCGTDAAEMSLSNGGVVTGGIGIPNRYMHSVIGTVSIDDVWWSAELIAEFIKGLKQRL